MPFQVIIGDGRGISKRILANWWWLAPLVLLALGGLKLAAKRTESVWDDRIVTLLIFLVKGSRGKFAGILGGIRDK